MNLNDGMKQFIEEYVEFIEQNKWEIIYIDLDVDITGMFTKTMLDAGIDPLVNMNKIPENFLRHQKVGSFKVPPHIKSIEYAAFMDTDISMIVLPEGVVEIGDCVFDSCKNLTEVHLPSSLRFIGEFAFSDCPKLKHVYYIGTITEFQNTVAYHTNIFQDAPINYIECSDGVINI